MNEGAEIINPAEISLGKDLNEEPVKKKKKGRGYNIVRKADDPLEP